MLGGARPAFQDGVLAPHPVFLYGLSRPGTTPAASYAAPSGYSNASFSSFANVSTVVPVRFHAPSLSNR